MDTITPGQCRAARALLRWKQDDLKEASGVAKKTIADFELEQRQPYDRTLLDVRGAFERAGIEFIAENGGGVGVRLKKRAGKSRLRGSELQSAKSNYPIK